MVPVLRILSRVWPWAYAAVAASKTRQSRNRRMADCTASGLVELERLVQHADRELHVLFVHHHGDLDLGGGDHLDIDALLGKRAEHLRRDASVRAHAHADD